MYEQKPTRLPLLVLLSLGVSAPAAVYADVNGSVTVRAEDYDNDGDVTHSPYPEEGEQYYTEFNLNLSKQNSAYDNVRAQIFGVFNDSYYRQPDYNGFIPERLNLTWEKGDAKTPFRLQAGDYQGYLSYRVLQRSLKGFQLEMQPNIGDGERSHSVILLTGIDQPTWRSLDIDNDETNAMSWLTQDEKLGLFSANMVRSQSDADPATGLLERHQYVFSLANQKQFDTPDRLLELEAEFAAFDGDHDGINTPADGQEVSDNGFFLQLSGQEYERPIDYRVRYENYGKNYRPAGAYITPDRRSLEGFLTWRSDAGIVVEGRVQDFRDNAESSNPTDTTTVGVQVSGLLLGERVNDLTGNLHFFTQDMADNTKSVDQESKTLKLNVSKPLKNGWVGDASLFLQDIDDQSSANADQDTTEVSLAATRAIAIGNFYGSITPGVVWRDIEGGADNKDISPTLKLSLFNDQHSINFNYNQLSQDFQQAGVEVDTVQSSLNYRFNVNPQNTVGVEWNRYKRDPDNSQDTTSRKLGVFWTYRFDRPSPVQPTAEIQSDLIDLLYTEAWPTDSTLLRNLAPGQPIPRITAKLNRTGLPYAIERPNTLSYETRLLNGVQQRQQLVLQMNQDKNLEVSSLLIDFDNVGSNASAEHIFERIKSRIIRQLGQPDSVYNEGEFSGNLHQDVNSGRLVRNMEWPTSFGVLRFGIPRTLDGKVRMELSHTPERIVALNDSRWGLRTY